MSNKNKNRPFLKWAGNKYRILDHILPILPEGERLIEPFAGSGALFLNSNFKRYVLSDANVDLINLYKLLRDEGEDFIKYCKRFFSDRYNNSETYYKRRDEFNKTKNIRKKSALFIYLNRHCYNGLCRYNLSGGFNVPFGRFAKPYFPEKEMLFFHEKSQKAIFKHMGFEVAFSKARKGDVIYCDPPYVPLSPSSNFTTYSAGGFSSGEQESLAIMAENAAKSGIPVLLSNHNTSESQQYYKNATQINEFYVRRYISCNGKKRQHAGELTALYIGKNRK